MLENYAFFAMFTLQILVMSVLHPTWFIQFIRAKETDFPDELYARLFPGVDRQRVTQRFLTVYRALNTVIALLGLALLGWLLTKVRRTNWDDAASMYFMVQVSPLLLLALLAVKHRKIRSSLLQVKRKATLQRRGLFDFVSPFVVFLAVLGYALFVAFVIYIQRNPFPGFAGYTSIGAVTLIYALNAFCIYISLYGRKFNPLETHASRVHSMGRGIKAGVYGCIICVAFLSLNFALALLDLRSWKPFAVSTFFVVTALLCSSAFIAPPRRPEADGLGPSPVP